MRKIIDLIGQRFSMLCVLSFAGRDKYKKALWNCVCDCGNVKIVLANELKRGSVKSCGCLMRGSRKNTVYRVRERLFQKSSKFPRSRVYNIWNGMKARCFNINQPRYMDYGGRGITVCDKWLKFEGFWEDMEEGYASNLTLDRKDNNKGYSKHNCRWATQEEQQSNRRSNHLITIDGKTDTLTHWCKHYRLKHSTFKERVRSLGWDENKAITTPARRYGNKITV